MGVLEKLKSWLKSIKKKNKKKEERKSLKTTFVNVQDLGKNFKNTCITKQECL